MNARTDRLEARPLSGALGAEIHGVDLSQDLDAETIAEIRRHLLSFGVIFFRDQNLGAERHKVFARKFGTIFIHPYLELEEDPEFVWVRREPGDASAAGDSWHSDAPTLECPPMGSILCAVEVPPYGGDTLFANQYLAYESLSAEMKRLLAGLKVRYSDAMLVKGAPQAQANAQRSTKFKVDPNRSELTTLHPVVRTHPETGRKCLYVTRKLAVAIEGMTPEESRGLLDHLAEQGQRPEVTCRFRWEPGSIAFWDNRCTKHYAINDPSPIRRIMRRVQLVGERPV